MFGQPGPKTRQHNRLPSSFLGMNACMTSHLNEALIDKLRGSFMCLAYFSICYPWVFDCLYNQPLVEFRLTGAGIKCLYCILYHSSRAAYCYYSSHMHKLFQWIKLTLSKGSVDPRKSISNWRFYKGKIQRKVDKMFHVPFSCKLRHNYAKICIRHIFPNSTDILTIMAFRHLFGVKSYHDKSLNVASLKVL